MTEFNTKQPSFYRMGYKAILVFAMILLLSACTSVPRLELTWTTQGPFISPESAIYDPTRDAIYISNVNGYTTNGIGFLSKLDTEGNILVAKWMEGLNAPTGMTIDGDTLYVVDFNRLVEIDIPSETIKNHYPAPDENPGLNDVAISPDGDIYVTASNIGTVYQLEDGELKTWLQSDKLEYANGIWADEEEVIVAAFHLRRINIQSKEISDPIGIEVGLEDLESIEPDGNGEFFITLIGVKPIMYMNQRDQITPLLERDVFSADVEFVKELNMLIAPSGEDTVSSFYFKATHQKP